MLEIVPASYNISNLAVFLDRHHQPMVLQKADILASRQKLAQQGGKGKGKGNVKEAILLPGQQVSLQKRECFRNVFSQRLLDMLHNEY